RFRLSPLLTSLLSTGSLENVSDWLCRNSKPETRNAFLFLVSFARYKLGSQRQLVRGKTQRLLRIRASYTFHLKQHLARTHDGYPVIRCTFAFAHTGFGGLLCHRLIREQTQPDLAATLYEARHGNTAGFDLAVGDVAALEDLQSVITEGELGTTPSLSGHASALLLAVLNFFRHQHKNQLSAFSSQPNRSP